MDPCEHEQQMDDDNRRMLGRTTELIGLRDSQPARERLAARVRNMRRIGDFQVPFRASRVRPVADYALRPVEQSNRERIGRIVQDHPKAVKRTKIAVIGVAAVVFIGGLLWKPLGKKLLERFTR